MTHSHTRSPARGRHLRAGLLLAGGSVALLALAGCSPAATPTPTPKPTSTSTSTTATDAASAPDAPAASATPAPTPTAEPAGAPVALICDQVLTPQDVYDFNPNFGTAPGYQPTGDAAKTAASYDGVTCGWLNQSSGDIIEISVALPNDVLSTTLKNQAVSDSNIVPTYGTPPAAEGYFSASGGTGEAQVFTGAYWVTAASVEFGEPGDAAQLMGAVVSHLP